MRTGTTRRSNRRSPLRTTAALAIGLLPHSTLKISALRRICRWTIDPTARVGPCILHNVDSLVLQEHATLGLSAFSNLQKLQLGRNSVIGHWNWVSAAPQLLTPGLAATPGARPAELCLEDSAAVTSRHYLDCSGGVRIGAFSVMAGVRSTIVTHQVDTLRSEQEIRPVTIGRYCLVGSNVKLVPGAAVPDRSTIAMGSVVVGRLEDEGMLYGGVPARRIKDISSGRYFSRSTRFADIP